MLETVVEPSEHFTPVIWRACVDLIAWATALPNITTADLTAQIALSFGIPRREVRAYIEFFWLEAPDMLQ
jgi:hypothetical protein